MSSKAAEHRRLAGRLVVATHNPGKLKEMRELLMPFGIDAVSAGELGLPEPAENGPTFKENARIKARAAATTSGLPAFADDSGLTVDALGGAPGILSARYAGQNASDKQNIDKLLGELARVGARAKRSARFRCVIALARKGKLLGTFEGMIEGMITEQARGLRGFGYDPIFVPRGFEETFAELPAELKNSISHRAKAIRALAAKLGTLRTDD